MTLGGLAIAVGLLVDAGVIMVENLVHRLATRPREAADPGERRTVLAAAAAEVAVPIVIAVAVILAVFVPLLALPGVAGRLYAPLAVAVASAMTISLALSFTLVPVLVDRFLPAGTSLAEPRFVAGSSGCIGRRSTGRCTTVSPSRSSPSPSPCRPSGSRRGFGTEFLPALDEGAVMVQTLLPSDASVTAVDEANFTFESDLAALPGVVGVSPHRPRSITEDPMPHSISDILIVLDRALTPRRSVPRSRRWASARRSASR